MSKEIPQLLKGFRDYLPQEQTARKKIISKISEIFERFGFAPLDTPALEYYELLGGKYGDEGEKLMYRFKDQGDRDVALRYDLTVPLARVFAENKDLPKPFKRYQIAPVWRADKPQKGRFREFMQCDIDILGSESALADVEVIAALNAAYEALEIQNFQVKFNDRKLIDQALVKLNVSSDQAMNFMRTVDKLDKVGETEIIKTLVDQGFDKNILSQYSDMMDELSKEYVIETENLLSGLGVKAMRFDKYLMRGLDYYTGIIFEFVLLDQPEFGSVGSGGRYDGLIEKTTGVKTPAVGASLGLDRLFAALEDKGKISPQTSAEVIVFNLDENLTADYLNMVTNLRNAGIDAEIYYDTVKLDKQFKYAETKNIQAAIIYGADEAKNRKVNIKNLKDKEQKTVDLDDLVTEVKSILW
jgi:histidyl-tRNA synthetase